MKKSASESSSPKPRTKVPAESKAEPVAKPPAPKPRKVAKKADTPPKPTKSAAAPSRAPILKGGASTLTVVAARADIGFGNQLFLRGTGPGLSWDTGTPMVNAGCDLWTIDIYGATDPLYCKFLINDELWSVGPDYIIDPGAQLEVTPLF